VHIPEGIALPEGFAEHPADPGRPASRIHRPGQFQGGDETAEGNPQVMNRGFRRTTAHARELAEELLPAVIE